MANIQEGHYDLCRWLYSKVKSEQSETADYHNRYEDSKKYLVFLPQKQVVNQEFSKLLDAQKAETDALRVLYNTICAPIIEQEIRKKQEYREREEEAYAERVREMGRSHTYAGEPYR